MVMTKEDQRSRSVGRPLLARRQGARMCGGGPKRNSGPDPGWTKRSPLHREARHCSDLKILESTPGGSGRIDAAAALKRTSPRL